MMDADELDTLGQRYGNLRVMTLAAFLRRTHLSLTAEDIVLMASPTIAPPVTAKMVEEVAHAVGVTLASRRRPHVPQPRDIF